MDPSIGALPKTSPSPAPGSSPSPVSGKPGELGDKPLRQVESSGASVIAASSSLPHVEHGPARLALSGKLTQVLGEFSEESPCLHNRCGPRVRDAASLIDLVGHPPKENRLGGLYQMSVRYKAVLGALDTHRQALENKIPAGSDAVIRAADGHIRNLETLSKAADAYITKHEGKKGQESAVHAMGILKKEIRHEISLINTVTQSAPSGGLEGMTWGDAMSGANYRLLDSVSRLHDGALDTARSVEKFGSGQVSQVSKLVYGEGAGAKVTVFKPDPPREESDQVAAAILSKIEIDPEAPCYAARNVATAFINESLGQKNITHCDLALHNGEIGIAMDMAPGKPLQSTRLIDPPPHHLAGLEDDSLDPEMVGAKKVDGEWKTEKIEVRVSTLTNGDAAITANLQKELIGLQWIDAICGQVDRHAENYLVKVDSVSKEVTVSGIDNDFSFGRKPSEGSTKLLKSVGLPPLIDKDTSDRLKATDFDRDLAPTLETLLSREELAAAKSRFTEVQTHARELETAGRAVTNWQTWTDDGGNSVTAVLTAAGPEASYYARECDSEAMTQ